MIAETRYSTGATRWRRTELGEEVEDGELSRREALAVTQVACLAELASGGEAATLHAAQGTGGVLTACLDTLELRFVRMCFIFL